MHAAMNGFYYGVDKLLKLGADVNIVDNDGCNLLLHAASAASYLARIVGKIIELTDNKNCADLEGNTVISYLVYHENLNSTESLIRAGADINKGNALCMAIKYTRIELVPLLVNFGADVNFPDKYGHTPLYYALSTIDNMTNMTAVVRFLINHGAVVEEDALIHIHMYGTAAMAKC